MLRNNRSDRRDESFEALAKEVNSLLRSCIAPFIRDNMLRRFQSADDLYNIALAKLDEASRNFVYDESLDETHNDRKFLAMVKTYVRNAMIDEQYGANVAKRKPKGPIAVISTAVSDDPEADPSHDPEDKSAGPHDKAEASEMIAVISKGLGDEERSILALVCDGYPAERIAGKLGLNISRVRYVIYEKIQPKAKRYAGIE